MACAAFFGLGAGWTWAGKENAATGLARCGSLAIFQYFALRLLGRTRSLSAQQPESNMEKIKKELLDLISVDYAKILMATKLVLDEIEKIKDEETYYNVKKIIAGVINVLGFKNPSEELNLKDEETKEKTLKHVADIISWKLAICESIWRLINNNVIVPDQDNNDLIAPFMSIKYKTNGYASSLSLGEVKIKVPSSVKFVPSHAFSKYKELYSGEIYLNNFEINNMSRIAKESLLDSIKCFRHELFVPCVVMLGKASESAWIELSRKLISWPGSDINVKDLHKVLSGDFPSIHKIMNEVLKIYEHQLPKEYKKRIGITDTVFKEIYEWSNLVRMYRNTIHPESSFDLELNYESTSLLMLSAIPKLKSIYAIIGSIGEDG